MPKAVGLGMDEEVKAASKISRNLLMGRGARIAIARMCKELLGKHLRNNREALVAAFKESGEADETGAIVLKANDVIPS